MKNKIPLTDHKQQGPFLKETVHNSIQINYSMTFQHENSHIPEYIIVPTSV